MVLGATLIVVGVLGLLVEPVLLRRVLTRPDQIRTARHPVILLANITNLIFVLVGLAILVLNR